MIKTIKGAVQKLKTYFNRDHLQGHDDFPDREGFLTHEEYPEQNDSLNQVDFVDQDDIQQVGHLTGRSIKFLEHFPSICTTVGLMYSAESSKCRERRKSI